LEVAEQLQRQQVQVNLLLLLEPSTLTLGHFLGRAMQALEEEGGQLLQAAFFRSWKIRKEEDRRDPIRLQPQPRVESVLGFAEE